MQTKKEKRKQVEEKRKQTEEDEELKEIRSELMEKEGVFPVIFEVLKTTINLSTEAIAEEMKKGNIPFHLEESEQWAAFGSQLQSVNELLKKKMEERNQLEDTIRKQEAELAANMQKFEVLDRTFPAMKKMQEDISTVVPIIPLLSKTEVQLAKEIQECIAADPEDLVARGEDGPALSLVFNSIGFSAESIATCANLDGFEFLINHPKLPSFEQQKEALYLRHMLSKKQVPYSKHIEECAICSCGNGEELRYLMEEHRKKDEVAALLFASPIPLPGRYFLFLEFEDIINHFKLSITMQQFKTFQRGFKTYFLKFHREAFTTA